MTGYKLPPTATQFKPGQSGNPKGRPKGCRNTYTLLNELLHQKILITQDGRQLKIDKQTAILLQAVNRAVKGDLRAIKTYSRTCWRWMQKKSTWTPCERSYQQTTKQFLRI